MRVGLGCPRGSVGAGAESTVGVEAQAVDEVCEGSRALRSMQRRLDLALVRQALVQGLEQGNYVV